MGGVGCSFYFLFLVLIVIVSETILRLSIFCSCFTSVLAHLLTKNLKGTYSLLLESLNCTPFDHVSCVLLCEFPKS